MTGWVHDARQALRRLRREPLTAAVSALTLALGIGAATSVFALVQGVLWTPLGYPEADRLVKVHRTLEALRESPNPRLADLWNRLPVSYLFAEDLRRADRPLSGVGLYLGGEVVVDGPREPEGVAAARIDPHLLRVLGVQPEIGRLFLGGDVADGAPRVLLGHGFWRGAFGGDPGIVGRSVRIDGEPHAVVGVMPPGFQLPGREDRLWTLLVPGENDRAFRDDYRYEAIGRLAPGWTVAEAGAALDRLAERLATEHPASDAGAGARIVPLLDTLVGDGRRSLGLLSIAAMVVLAVACVNVLHLLLVRGAARRRELALRRALGAGRGRLVRSLALDALWIALAGGVGGFLLAVAGVRVLPLWLAGELPRLDQVAIDARVVLFALGASLFAALAAGLAPALAATGATGVGPRTAIDDAGADRPPPGARRRGQGALVILEVALTMALACAAGVLAVSWLRLSAVDPGFEARGVLVQELRLPGWRYPEPGDRTRAAERIVQGLRALPGAEGAALTSRLPVSGPLLVGGFRIAGRDAAGGDWTQGRSAGLQAVSPGYFELLEIPIVAGRALEPDESRPAVVVSRSLADAHFPGARPFEEVVGEEIVLGETTYSVVGVAGDVRHQGLEAEAGDLILRPWAVEAPAAMAALVRFGGGGADPLDPLDRADDVRRAIRAVDPDLALPPAGRLDERVAGSLTGPRSRALFVGLSAGIALLLAAAGIYGVVSHGVGRRRREIGIRMALGADAAAVRRSVVTGALVPALVGVALGAAGAVAGGKLLESLVYGTAPAEPAVLAAMAAALLAVCWAAAWGPARRASRIDPVRVLTRS